MKQNLLVTLADKNYIQQARQLFSSVYWNAGWNGDYMLLSHGIPDDELKWFTDKGILVKKCQPLHDKSIGLGYDPIVLDKFYLFTPEFKQWKNIVFLDSDIIVKGPLNRLTKIKGFGSVCSTLKLAGEFIKTSVLYKEIENKYNLKKKCFCTGVMAFSTDIIREDTLQKLIELFDRYHDTVYYAEEGVFNLFFYKKWIKIPIVYGLYVPLFYINEKYKDVKIKAIAMHFVKVKNNEMYKPWRPDNKFYPEWAFNLERAELINLQNRQKVKDWNFFKITYYSLLIDIYVFLIDIYIYGGFSLYKWICNLVRKIINPLKRMIGLIDILIGLPERMIGLTGKLIKRFSPRLYYKIKTKTFIKFLMAPTVRIARAGGTSISPFAFGNCYFNWVDYYKDGMIGLLGTEEPVKALHLNVIVGANNQNDANAPELFDKAQIDKYIQYCRAVGAEPIMIVPVYGNNVDGGPTSAHGAADIVTYVNGTKKYGVRYWSIGTEVDIYDIFFKRTTDLPVSTVSEYASIYNSYARAMKAANAEAHSGIEIKFVGPELGARYSENNDWLSPMLDECKEYIDIVSIHAYGFAANELSAEAYGFGANELSAEGVLNDVEEFRQFVKYVKTRVAKHARPGTPLAITQANVCYDWIPHFYTPETRKVGPGTFYAAIWNADRMGAALEANLWTFAFWDLAEPIQHTDASVFGFLLTDPSKNPPTYKPTPEYYTQQMVTTNFSGNTVIPSGVQDRMSVYACYDVKKASTIILTINKDTVMRSLKFKIDNLKQRKIIFSPMSINIVTIPDDDKKKLSILEYTMQMADAGLPPKVTR